MGELRQDQKTKTAIVTALALSFATTVQAQTYTIDGTRPWFGCQSREVFDLIHDYAAVGDSDGMIQILAAQMVAGGCIIFEAGEIVMSRELKLFGGVVRVSRRGEVLSYWTNIEAITD